MKLAQFNNVIDLDRLNFGNLTAKLAIAQLRKEIKPGIFTKHSVIEVRQYNVTKIYLRSTLVTTATKICDF